MANAPATRVDRGRLEELTRRELERFAAAHPASWRLSEQARQSLIGGVPMPWMMRWAGGFPPFAARAAGASITDVDGHEYVDFCLGDTGAMTGHSPPAVMKVLLDQGQRGLTVFSYCYHGSVDETFAVRGPGGATVSREGNVGPPVDPAITTEAIEFNDLPALEAALSDRSVACVLAEPAMTNMGIIRPEPGYWLATRCRWRRCGRPSTRC